MLLCISLTRDGEYIGEKYVDDGKDHTKYLNQEFKAWAKEIAERIATNDKDKS